MSRITTTAVLCSVLAASAAQALPQAIIILRHGEKPTGHNSGFFLCSIGVLRSEALAVQYLGKGAKDSLFIANKDPAAFLTITPHTLELAAPAAGTWSLPLISYSVLPGADESDSDKTKDLNFRTQQAAHDALTNPDWNGKTVVMTWEHKHIADKKLEEEFPGQKVTLRQLLNLDKLGSAVPDTWSGNNYDYFWIARYSYGSTTPYAFQAIKQHFSGKYSDLPHNDWDKHEKLPKDSGCES